MALVLTNVSQTLNKITCRCLCDKCTDCLKKPQGKGGTVVVWCGGSGHKDNATRL